MLSWRVVRGSGSTGTIAPAHGYDQLTEGVLREGADGVSLIVRYLAFAATEGEKLRIAQALGAARRAMEISERLVQ